MLDRVIHRFYGSILEMSMTVRDGNAIWMNLIFLTYILGWLQNEIA